MFRRDLLIGGAGAGSLALGGCAGAGPTRLVTPASIAESEAIEDRWRAVEAVREAIAARPRVRLDTVLDRGRSRGKLALSDDLGRRAARSLLVTGAFRDLPEDARTHPVVQHGLRAAMPEMDDAFFGVQSRLDAQTPTERADIARELRQDPELGQRVLRLLDLEASEVGASETRRLHMRALGLGVCERLHQSSEQLIGEYRSKLERVVARHGSDVEAERRLAAALGQASFAALRERTIASHEKHRAILTARRRGAATDAWTPASEPESVWTRADSVLTVGGVLLGVAVLSGVAGGLLVAGGGLGGAFLPGAILLTFGALHLLAGLIVLIVGAAMKANEE